MNQLLLKVLLIAVFRVIFFVCLDVPFSVVSAITVKTEKTMGSLLDVASRNKVLTLNQRN